MSFQYANRSWFFFIIEQFMWRWNQIPQYGLNRQRTLIHLTYEKLRTSLGKFGVHLYHHYASSNEGLVNMTWCTKIFAMNYVPQPTTVYPDNIQLFSLWLTRLLQRIRITKFPSFIIYIYLNKLHKPVVYLWNCRNMIAYSEQIMGNSSYLWMHRDYSWRRRRSIGRHDNAAATSVVTCNNQWWSCHLLVWSTHPQVGSGWYSRRLYNNKASVTNKHYSLTWYA